MKSTHRSWCVDFLYTAIIHPFVRTNKQSTPTYPALKNKVLYRTKGICRFSQARTLGRASPFSTARANLGFFVFPFVRTNEKKHPKRVLSLCKITNFDTISKWVHFRAKWVQKFLPNGFTSFDNGFKRLKNGFNNFKIFNFSLYLYLKHQQQCPTEFFLVSWHILQKFL